MRGMILCLAAMMFVGCAAAPVPKMDNTKKRLATLSSIYLLACQTLGRAPTKFEELQPFLPAGQGTLAELCQSDRDGQPFVVTWGFDTRGPQEQTWVLAYEQAGANGKRYAVDMMQSVVEVGPDDFAKLPFPPGHEMKK